MIDKQEVKRVATRIGHAAEAEKVVLFGSHAKGHAGEDSDVDLLINSSCYQDWASLVPH
jgi:predicted nucleotidyltransferase